MDTNQKQFFQGYVKANSNCFKITFQRLEVQRCFFAYYHYYYHYYCCCCCCYYYCTLSRGQKGPMNQLSVFLSIVRKGVPGPLFKAPTPWSSLSPLFKILVSLSICSVPPSFKVFYRVPPTLATPSALIQPPTNLPWFKQISKG